MDIAGTAGSPGLTRPTGRDASLAATTARERLTRLREKLIVAALAGATVLSAAIVVLIVVFILQKALPTLAYSGLGFITKTGWDQQFDAAYNGTAEVAAFGALELVVGTILTTGGALVLTVILGTGTAVVLAELAPPAIIRAVEPFVRLLAGIPSVVFGLVGLVIVVPFIQSHFITDRMALKYIGTFPLDGPSLLAGVVVLTFMILPFYVAVAVDSLKALPPTYKEGALAIGVTPWRVVTRVLLPAATPGIVAGLVLSAGRAIGEAIALSMVTGGIAFIPRVSDGPVVLLEPVRTLAATIVESSEGLSIPALKGALFSICTVLLAFSLSLSLTTRVTLKWFQRRMGLVSDRIL